jgi:hypothetical protein
MSFKLGVLISIIVSLCSGAGVFFLVAGRTGGVPQDGPGYGVLYLDQAYPDRTIGEALALGGVDTYISESTQWVFLDDFGEPLVVPLDAYPDRVESFDPRNDGYAEGLHAFFVRDGWRRFFIPLKREPLSRGLSGASAISALEARIDTALGDIPHTVKPLLSHTRQDSRPWLKVWLFPLYFAALAGAAALSGSPLAAASLIPLSTALAAAAGPTGLALGGVFFALFGSLLTPLREFFISRRIAIAGQRGIRSIWFFLGMFKRNRAFSLFFLGVYGAILFCGALPVFPGLLALVCFFWVFCTALWAESNRGKSQGHIRFSPVSIQESAGTLYSRGMIPFALASLGALLLSPLVMDTRYEVSAAPEPFLISAADYENHLAYQASFSQRPLGGGSPGYEHYRLGDDGLIDSIDYGAVYGSAAALTDGPNYGPAAAISEGWASAPPFPLETLMAFLEGNLDEGNLVPQGTNPKGIRGVYNSGDLNAVALALILVIPVLFSLGQKPRRQKRLFVYHDKRAAA